MVNHRRIPLEEDDRPARPPPAVHGHLVSALLQRLGHPRLPGLLRGGRLPESSRRSTWARRPQDMADFIEYVNGPADSEWGRRRAADGHPEPYRLKHLELGNEERVDERLLPRSSRRWPRRSGRRTRRSSWWSATSPTASDRGPVQLHAARPRASPASPAQQQILQLAREHDREVWFDVHVGTERPAARFDLGGHVLVSSSPGQARRRREAQGGGLRVQRRQPRAASGPWPTPSPSRPSSATAASPSPPPPTASSPTARTTTAGTRACCS